MTLEEKLKWIPVQDKKPKSEDNFSSFSVPVLVKSKTNYFVAVYLYDEDFWNFEAGKLTGITHLRDTIHSFPTQRPSDAYKPPHHRRNRKSS